jgi:hypothetical protein
VGNGKTGATPQRSKSAVIVSRCSRPASATGIQAGFSPRGRRESRAIRLA